MTLKVTDDSFEADVFKASLPVVVDFWAEWCGPCRAIAPFLEELSAELAGRVQIAKINVDENSDIPSKFGIMSIPTLILFKNGEVVAKKVGASSKRDILDWIQSVS